MTFEIWAVLLKAVLLYICVFNTPVKTIDEKNQQTAPLTSYPDVNKSKLQHLHVLFRHGDRTPFYNPFEPTRSFVDLWPAGRGQLTDKGIRQEFQLGQWLRKEYGHFIPSDYNGSDFHMRSTDIDRTLMSAQSVIAGVYQNTSFPLEHEDINWRPIPVHTVQQSADVLLSTAYCPCLNLLRDLKLNSPESIEFEKNHSSFFNLLSTKVKQKIDRINLWTISDTLICSASHNMTIPDWVTDDLLAEMLVVNTYFWNVQFASSQDILRLEIGVFLKAFTSHVQAVVSSTNSPTVPNHQLSIQHTMAYSSHDTDVTYLLGALGSFDNHMVNYSAAVVLELLGPEPPALTSDYLVRVRYKRGYPDSEGEYRPMAACPDRAGKDGCRLDLVLAYLEPFSLSESDFLAVCRLSQESDSYGLHKVKYIDQCSGTFTNDRKVIYSVVGVLIVVCAIALVVFLSMRWRRRHRLHYWLEE